MLERLHRWMTGHENAADGVASEARDAIPRNFVTYVATHLFTKLGDALMNPKTTLTWVGGSLGVPTAITALYVPVRESGSMIFQAAMSGWIETFRLRKRVWLVGGVTQAAAVLSMALVTVTLEGTAAGLALLGLLALFALARSLCSISSKDVLGRTVPKRQRGRASGWAAGAAGIMTMLAGGIGLLYSPQDIGVRGLALVLAIAGSGWLIASALFATIREPESEPGEDSPRDVLGRLHLLVEDAVLRRFVVTRALLLCSALSAPYYVLLAHRHLGDSSRLLLAFIVASGLAGLLGGPVWGRVADWSSKRTMSLAVSAAAALSLAVFFAERANATWLDRAWPLPLAFFLLSLAHEGVRVGRHTWVVNIAEGDRRTDYVSVSNSAMGAILLVVGAAGAALSSLSVEWVLLGLSLMGVTGAALGARLPEAETESGS